MKFKNKTTNNIISASQEFINSLQNKEDYELVVEEVVYRPPLDELKSEKIQQLQDKYQAEYDTYLSKYPKREIESFDDKKREALAYNADDSASTPLVDAMVGGDADLRIEMLNAILAKVLYLAAQEGQMVATRDVIKACTTQDELDAIEI